MKWIILVDKDSVKMRYSLLWCYYDCYVQLKVQHTIKSYPNLDLDKVNESGIDTTKWRAQEDSSSCYKHNKV